MADTFDVFLCHHSGDKPWVIGLKVALAARGVKVWLDQDELRPGDRFRAALEQAIPVCRSVAVIISPASLRSGWVQDEIDLALNQSNTADRELRVIPCLHSGPQPPGFLSNRLWVDFRDPKAFNDKVDQLTVGITGSLPARPADSAAPSQQAIEVGNLPSGSDSTLKDFAREAATYLDGAIARVVSKQRQVTVIRLSAAGIGAGIAYWAPPVAYVPTGISLLAYPVVLGLFAFATTQWGWATRRQELALLTEYQAGLVLCSKSFDAVCPKFHQAFQRFMLRKAGIEPTAG